MSKTLQKFTSVQQVLAEFANRRKKRKLEREAIQMDRERPQEPKWCYTCQRNVTTPVNHLAQWHHVAGMTMINAHQCPGNDATNCGKSGTHMGQLTS